MGHRPSQHRRNKCTKCSPLVVPSFQCASFFSYVLFGINHFALVFSSHSVYIHDLGNCYKKKTTLQIHLWNPVAIILQIFAEYFQCIRYCSERQGSKDIQITISLHLRDLTACSQGDKQGSTDSCLQLMSSTLEISTGCYGNENIMYPIIGKGTNTLKISLRPVSQVLES